MKPNFINVSICILVLIIVGAACSSFTKGKAAGEKAVENFHAQLNAENYDEIYEKSAKGFKDSASKEEIIKFLSAVHRKLGDAETSSQQGWHVNATPTGSVVTLSYETTFTNDKAEESFTFFMNGDDAQLAGYNINSKKLITE